MVHGQNRGQVGNRWFASRIPIADDCSLRAQHIELGLASSGEVRMNKGRLLAGCECHRDVCVICIRCMSPDALVVLSAHVSNIVWNDVQNLIEEMTAPVKDRSTRNLGF